MSIFPMVRSWIGITLTGSVGQAKGETGVAAHCGIRPRGSDVALSPYLLAGFGICTTCGFGFVSNAAFSTAVSRSCRSGIHAA